MRPMATDDHSTVRKEREQRVLRMLLRATQSANEQTIAGLKARGHDLRPSFTMLLGNLDTDGTRLGAIARRMGVSRQAVSQLLEQIEERGLVTRAPDPADARGVIVRFTPKGRRTLEAGIDVMVKLEQGYERAMGARDFARLRALLARFVEVVDPAGGFGLD